MGVSHTQPIITPSVTPGLMKSAEIPYGATRNHDGWGIQQQAMQAEMASNSRRGPSSAYNVADALRSTGTGT